MKENEAKELLEKLKPLEKRAEMKKGGTIDKFFVVPKEYITDENYEIDWFNYWNSDIAYSSDKKNGKEFTIIAVKKAKSGELLVSKDFDYIQELGQYQ